jgi:hypothetical protein
MQESNQVRRAKLAEGIARKRRLLYTMKFVPLDKLPSELRERHVSVLQEMTEELHEMESEFHDLNVGKFVRRRGTGGLIPHVLSAMAIFRQLSTSGYR